MIASFWVSFGLLMGVLALHLFVPPISRLLRLPTPPNTWIVAVLGLSLGAGRFWTLFVAINALSLQVEDSFLPPGWFAHAVYTLIGLLTLVVYMAWMAALDHRHPRPKLAAILAPIYLAVIMGETLFVGLRLTAQA